MGLLEPVSAAVFAGIILSEPISITTLTGGGLILLGAFLVSRESQWNISMNDFRAIQLCILPVQQVVLLT
jgi:drug/metabolite transporter (DMT)-like permease